MKALVLAGGRGKRLDHWTENTNKCMMLLLNKPLVQYSLENAVAAGVNSIVIVVGYQGVDIINRFGTKFGDTDIQYVIQPDPKGVVHAIECAREAIGASDFMLFLADEILNSSCHEEMARRFREENLFGVCGVVYVKDRSQISKTYTLIGDERTEHIHRLIEKPRVAINNIMGTGNCLLRAGIFDYIERTPINVERGEREVPDLIQCAIDEGQPVKYFNIGEGYININTADDITTAEERYQTRLRTR